MMIDVRKYSLPPTKLVPNSPYPLLHYPGILSREQLTGARVHDLYAGNGWETKWIMRYGSTQQAHYHSHAHEAMAILSGTATIRFGVADTSSDLAESTYGSGMEAGGVEIDAKAGDVFVLPAGTAHKTFNTLPAADFKILTPGDGHQIVADDPRHVLSEIQLDGFTMIGAYPLGSDWDFAVGKEDDGHFQETWNLPKPARDPVLGDGEEGLTRSWVS